MVVGLGKALRILGIPDGYVSAFSVLFKHKKRKVGTFGVYVLDEKDLELIKRVYERAKKERKKGVYIHARIKKIAKEEKRRLEKAHHKSLSSIRKSQKLV